MYLFNMIRTVDSWSVESQGTLKPNVDIEDTHQTVDVQAKLCLCFPTLWDRFSCDTDLFIPGWFSFETSLNISFLMIA